MMSGEKGTLHALCHFSFSMSTLKLPEISCSMLAPRFAFVDVVFMVCRPLTNTCRSVRLLTGLLDTYLTIEGANESFESIQTPEIVAFLSRVLPTFAYQPMACLHKLLGEAALSVVVREAVFKVRQQQ
jgi:hypothetical protein